MRRAIYRFLRWLRIIPDMNRESEIIRLRGDIPAIARTPTNEIGELGFSQLEVGARMALVAILLRRRASGYRTDVEVAREAAAFWWDVTDGELPPDWKDKPL